MSLPILPKATFPYKNKWLKGAIKFHPFTCGQESILVQVKDSEDPKEKLVAIAQILDECVTGADSQTLPLFAVEDLFLRIREKSAGETLSLTYVCSNEVELPEGPEGALVKRSCNTPVNVVINLKEVQLQQEGEHITTFQVSEDIGIKMTYPTLKSASASDSNPAAIVLSCIESIFDAETVYPAADSTPEELKQFYNSMPLSVKNEIKLKFFDSMPTLRYTIKAKCPKCGYDHVQEIESLNSIFT